MAAFVIELGKVTPFNEYELNKLYVTRAPLSSISGVHSGNPVMFAYVILPYEYSTCVEEFVSADIIVSIVTVPLASCIIHSICCAFIIYLAIRTNTINILKNPCDSMQQCIKFCLGLLQNKTS